MNFVLRFPTKLKKIIGPCSFEGKRMLEPHPLLLEDHVPCQWWKMWWPSERHDYQGTSSMQTNKCSRRRFFSGISYPHFFNPFLQKLYRGWETTRRVISSTKDDLQSFLVICGSAKWRVPDSSVESVYFFKTKPEARTHRIVDFLADLFFNVEQLSFVKKG